MSIEHPYQLHYSDVKPAAKFAREHWSNPAIHEPWKGFEDKTPDKKLQLKHVRRQVFNIATYFMERHGETATTIVPRLESMLFDNTRRNK